MLSSVLNDFSLKVMNFKEECVGKWTYVKTVNGIETKSVLDYCISNSTMSERLQSMIIDEEKLLCPFRIKKTKKTIRQTYSDHNALLMTFTASFSDMKKKRQAAIGQDGG